MKKYIKKHIKDEKHILKLMYSKGMFEALSIDFDSIGWEYLSEGKRKRKRKGKNFCYKDYLPQLHEYTVDYWGEGDSNSIVEVLRDNLSCTDVKSYDEDGFPYEFNNYTNRDLIKYLRSLPTKVSDSKINKYLIINQEY